MLIEERFERILDIVNRNKSVTVLELTELLNASESTIRRDLTQLHKLGRLNKVHGGATALNMSYNTKDSEIESRQELNKDDKRRIAEYAASLIEANDFVFIDAGSTTGLMIDYITETSATYVTNAIEHGMKLMHRGFKTYMLGGKLKAITEATIGSDTIMALERFNFTKGFWGTNGISLTAGYTTPDISEAMVKEKSMQRCQLCYIVCDQTKFNRISPVTFAAYDAAIIITTSISDRQYQEHENIIEIDEE